MESYEIEQFNKFVALLQLCPSQLSPETMADYDCSHLLFRPSWGLWGADDVVPFLSGPFESGRW